MTSSANDLKQNENANANDCPSSSDSINTDGRKKYDWEFKYPAKAVKEMRFEAIYAAAILAFALVCLLLNWLGIFGQLLKLDAVRSNTLERILYYFFAGLLGGVIYGMKYFYRVIARGYWTQDRRYWKIFSPWISSVIALIFGCMVLAGFINSTKEPTNALNVCLGFFAGYFADQAVGKMSEVAIALFGSNTKSK